MIEWIKYEPNNPPETGKPYLLHDYQGFITVGEITNVTSPPQWKEIYDEDFIWNVTHYAELNFPEVFKPKAIESSENTQAQAGGRKGSGGSHE